MCIDQGDGTDRLSRDWDNRIRSVEVYGDVEVDLCTDDALYGECITIRSGQGRLPYSLDGNVSSVSVY